MTKLNTSGKKKHSDYVPFAQSSMKNGKLESLSRNPEKKYVGVHKRKSGKYQAVIKDPFKKKRVWLGFFNTPEEAYSVYLNKKIEIEKELLSKNLPADSHTSNSNSTSSKRTKQGKYIAFESSSMENGVSGKQIKKYVGAVQTTFCAKIYDPFKKKRVWLGTFDTPEEASRVYLSKKLEIDKIIVSQMLQPVISKESKINDGENQVPKVDQKSKKYKYKYPGVWKRKSGRYSCEIKEPITKKRIYLGTFDTAEEAFNFYSKKKVEFQKQYESMKFSQPVLSEESKSCESPSSVLQVQGPQNNKESMEGQVMQDSHVEEVDLSTIMDNHGFLLGKWSWIDDLSIYGNNV